MQKKWTTFMDVQQIFRILEAIQPGWSASERKSAVNSQRQGKVPSKPGNSSSFHSLIWWRF